MIYIIKTIRHLTQMIKYYCKNIVLLSENNEKPKNNKLVSQNNELVSQNNNLVYTKNVFLSPQIDTFSK